MRLDYEEYVLDIADEVSMALGDVLEISTTRWIQRPVGKELVGDATLAFYVDGKRYKDDIVLLISNPLFPCTVAEDLAVARDIAPRVGQRIGRHIAAPVHEGRYDKQAYAAFSRLSPLSDLRFARLLQKPAASRRVLPWLIGLATDSREKRDDPVEFERYFIRPLQTLCDDEDLTTSVRCNAKNYIEYVRNSCPDLFTVIQHGDFWIGNVMFQRRMLPNLNPTLGDFTIIDWRGARTDGYPCMDLARFCLSINRLGSSSSRDLAIRYLDSLKISKFEMGVYCFLSLGRLGAELDQFPKERFCKLCDSISDFLQTTVVSTESGKAALMHCRSSSAQHSRRAC